MTKMRENTKYVLWIVVFSFGGLWMLMDTGALDQGLMGPGQNIIIVDNDPITYEEYQRVLQGTMDRYQQQTGTSLSPQMIDQLRESVYEDLVTAKLLEQEMERLGIVVTDEEVVNMITGDNPHYLILQNFSDGQGGVDRALLQNFIDNPEANNSFLAIEAQIRDEQQRLRLQQLAEASVRVSREDVLEEHERRNTKVNARFVALRYATLPDDSIEVTDADLRDYYNDNREDFRREKAYTINYVSLSKNPTEADTLLIMDEMEQLKPTFADAEDDSVFLARYASLRPYSGAFFRADDLEYDLAITLFENPEPGAVVGPVISNNEAHLLKIQEVRDAGDTVLRARHILIRAPESAPAETKQEARQQAQDLLQRLRNGEDFSRLAKAFSSDTGSGLRGGDLGWFGRGAMTEPFENAAYAARVGRVVGPVESQYGYHLIEVTGRSDVEIKIADYVQPIEASVQTLNNIARKLDDLQYFATESEDFAGEATNAGLEVNQVQVQADQTFFPSLGTSRTLANFMTTSSLGSISETIELDEVYIVAELSEILDEGYRTLEEARAEIEPQARLSAKKAYQKARMDAAFNGDFDALATTLGESERTVTNLQYSTRAITLLGNDPIFKATALSMDSGEVSNVVVGQNGVFVLQVTEKTEAVNLSQPEEDRLRTELLQQRRQQIGAQWIAALREQADIVDNRKDFSQ